MPASPRRSADVARSLAVLAVAALLAGCTDEPPPISGERATDEADRMDLEDLLDPEEAGGDNDDPTDETSPNAGLEIEPGTTLVPGQVATRVGNAMIAFDLHQPVEGGTVAPPDLPVALELVVDGGAIVVFEVVGHIRAGDPLEPELGLPDDLEVWLTTDLPDDLELVDGPTAIDDGITVSLHNTDDQQTVPVALWRAEGDPIDTFEGHGPPPGQTQHLWLRNINGAWVGVVTYGQDTDADLAEQVALSLRPHEPD